jgi:hypothetical protein
MARVNPTLFATFCRFLNTSFFTCPATGRTTAKSADFGAELWRFNEQTPRLLVAAPAPRIDLQRRISINACCSRCSALDIGLNKILRLSECFLT